MALKSNSPNYLNTSISNYSIKAYLHLTPTLRNIKSCSYYRLANVSSGAFLTLCVDPRTLWAPYGFCDAPVVGSRSQQLAPLLLCLPQALKVPVRHRVPCREQALGHTHTGVHKCIRTVGEKTMRFYSFGINNRDLWHLTFLVSAFNRSISP